MSEEEPEEEWRPIPGFPAHYQVSNLGGIKWLPYIDARGWHRKGGIVKLNKHQRVELNGKEKSLAALILLAFVGPPPEGKHLARHLDDNRLNNKLSNLAWGDDLDNTRDAIRNHGGTHIYASYGRLGKPCPEETKALLRKRQSGVKTGRKITKEHIAALRAGRNAKYPPTKKVSVLCGCGCGRMTRPGSSFVHGHFLIKRQREQGWLRAE